MARKTKEQKAERRRLAKELDKRNKEIFESVPSDKNKMSKLSTLIPIHELEHSCQQQIYNALNLDFVLKLAIMPDAHTGYLLCIGGVALLDGITSPNYVGYDVGCGMCCIVTDILFREAFKDMRAGRKVYERILEAVPVGKGNWHKVGPDYKEFKSAGGFKKLDKMIESRLHVQLGTLGSGNHFIEIGPNKDGYLTVVLHSGSRKPGWWVGDHYMSLAFNEDKHLPNGFLDMDGDLGPAYFEDMNFFLEYALENRRIMMEQVLNVLGFRPKDISEMMRTRMINENHNHAVVSNNGLYLHRKGATPSEIGEFGVVPGNMCIGTCITKGLGNDEFLKSASHGAGRKMSRGDANRRWKADEKGYREQAEKMMKGIVGPRLSDVKDEVPAAYKDLDQVIGRQAGIVLTVMDRIKPDPGHRPSMIVVKGD